jgi:hypothetical protein
LKAAADLVKELNSLLELFADVRQPLNAAIESDGRQGLVRPGHLPEREIVTTHPA